MPERFAGKTVFITGSGKNAGKTTFLNYAAARLRPLGGLAYMSVGVDGEKQDLVFGNPKPKIPALRGDFVVTTDAMLERSGAEYELLEVFPGATALGRIALARIKRGAFVELAGPENNARLAEVIGRLRGGFGIRTVLVDGAVNRVTQVASGAGAGFVFVSRVSRENFKSAADSLKLVDLLSRVPGFAAAKRARNPFFADGAFTAARAAAVPRGAETLILEDFTKVFVDCRQWNALSGKYRIFFRNVFEHIASAVNLYDVTPKELLDELGPAGRKVMFNPYMADIK